MTIHERVAWTGGGGACDDHSPTALLTTTRSTLASPVVVAVARYFCEGMLPLGLVLGAARHVDHDVACVASAYPSRLGSSASGPLRALDAACSGDD